MKVIVTVYVCPTDGCGDYYGSAMMGDMETVQMDKHSKPTFPRKRCPQCWTLRKAEVMRVPMTFAIDV